MQFEKDERGHTAKSLVTTAVYCAVEYAKVAYTLDSSISIQASFFWRFVEHLGMPCESFTVQAVREFFPVSFPGETLARQPEMFDKAPEKRRLNRHAAVSLTNKCAAAVKKIICSSYLYCSLAPLLLLLLLSPSL